jgi:hypothetical protein
MKKGHDGPTKLMIPRQPIAQAVRDCQYPLAHRNLWQYVIDQMRGALGHPPPATAWTEAAPLARERHQPIVMASGTVQPCESTGEPSAAKIGAELVFDESRQPLAVPEPGSLGTVSLEVGLNELMEHPVAWLPRSVLGWWRRHDAEPSARCATHGTAGNFRISGQCCGKGAEAALA